MRIAAILILALCAYFQLTQWVDLFPWNNIRGVRPEVTPSAIIGVLSLVMAVTMLLGWKEGALGAVIGLAAWGWLELQRWWLPWLNGASPAWTETYEARYSETIHWIPAAQGALPPDASHLVLHALIAVSLFAALSAFLARRR